MRRLFRWRYPKLTLLVICTVIAYLVFSKFPGNFLADSLGLNIYLSAFIAGLLFSFGFTTPFAIGIFLTLQPENIFLASTIAGLGALFSDLFIFSLIRFSFMDEFRKIEHTSTVKKVGSLIHVHFPTTLKHYLLFIFAGMIIASPLPDEIGVTILAGLGHIKRITFIGISFLFNFLGILVMLLIGS